MSEPKQNSSFYFIFGNHGPSPSNIEDFHSLLRDLVQYCTGQRLKVSRDIVPGHVNFVIENFGEGFADQIRRAKASHPESKFICLVTEFLTHDTFDNFEPDEGHPLEPKWVNRAVRSYVDRACPQIFRDQLIRRVPTVYRPARNAYFQLFGKPRPQEPLETHYADQKYWRKRYRLFSELIPWFDSVWYVSPSQRQGYEGTVPKDRLWHLPIIPFSEDLSASPRPDLDIDLLFTGTLTDYRAKLLHALERTGRYVVTGSSHLPEHIRRDYVGRAKICVHIKPSQNWRYSSNMRLHMLLMAGKVVVAEMAEDIVEQAPFVQLVPTEAFVDSCISSLKEIDFVEKGLEAKRAYIEATRNTRKRVKDEINDLLNLS